MIKIPSNVLAFAQDKVDVYKAFGDYFNHYRAEVLGAKVSFDSSVSLEEKSTKIHEAMKSEIARVANIQDFSGIAPEVWASNPQYKWATFAVIGAMVDMVLPQTIIDSIGMYTDVRTGGYGDSFAFDVKPRDLFVVTKAGRGKRRSEVHKQFEGQVTAIPVEHDITVEVSLYRVLAGQENLAEFAMKAARSMETQMTVDAYNAFDTAFDALTANATIGNYLRYTGYSQDKAVKLAQTVSAYNQGAKAVFVGTQLALSKIIPGDSNYRYMIDSDYVKLGYVRTAFGYDTLALPQVASLTTQNALALDDSRIYVVSPSSQKLVKLCIEGATMSITEDVYANANLAQATTMKKNWATAIATNSYYGVIDL